MKAIERVLVGVGDLSDGHLEEGDVAIHYRRPLTPIEEAQLPKHPDKIETKSLIIRP